MGKAVANFAFGPCDCCEPTLQMRWEQVQPFGWVEGKFLPPDQILWSKPTVEGGLILLNYRPVHAHDEERGYNPYSKFGGIILDGTYATWAIQTPTLESGTSYRFRFVGKITTDRVLTSDEVDEKYGGSQDHDAPPSVIIYFESNGGPIAIPGAFTMGASPTTFVVDLPAESNGIKRGSGVIVFGVGSGGGFLPGRAVWEMTITQERL